MGNLGGFLQEQQKALHGIVGKMKPLYPVLQQAAFQVCVPEREVVSASL